MQGVITDIHMELAERWFPGIRRFYQGLLQKPTTFLELVWKYEHEVERCTLEAPRASQRARRRLAR